MKSLTTFIREAVEGNAPSSKTFSFNFTDFEGAEDTLKSAKEIADKDGVDVEVEDSKISVKVSADNADKASGLFELLQDYIHLRGKDQKRAENESYAQKVSKCESTLKSYFDYLDDLDEADDEPEESDDKKEGEDKKEEE